MPGFSPGSPRALDRGDIATGGGADGEGERVPPPLSLTLPRSHISSPPHPTRAFGRGYPDTSLASPTPPAPSALLPRPLPGGVGSAWRYQGNSRAWGDAWCATVPGSSPAYSRILDRGDIAIGGGADGEGELVPPLLSLTLPRSHISSPPHPSRASGRGIPGYLAGLPHPSRAFGAPPPPPSGGRGQCMAISGEQPYPALLQDLPMLWTVGISPRGVGPTGRGNEFPLPCLLRSQNSEYLTDPVRVPCRWVPKELAGPPPLPRLRRSSPAPVGGVGSAWRYQGNSRIRLFSRISPRCGPCGYRHGGWGRRGGGTRSPSPVSNAPEIPHIFSAPPRPHLRRNTHTLLSAFLPVEDTRTLLFAPSLHHASGMRPVRPHGAVWWSIDRAEVSRACFGRQSLAEPPSPALQPAGGRDGGYIYIGTAR